jgi:hypothetical protein
MGQSHEQALRRCVLTRRIGSPRWRRIGRLMQRRIIQPGDSCSPAIAAAPGLRAGGQRCAVACMRLHPDSTARSRGPQPRSHSLKTGCATPDGIDRERAESGVAQRVNRAADRIRVARRLAQRYSPATGALLETLVRELGERQGQQVLALVARLETELTRRGRKYRRHRLRVRARREPPQPE